MKPTITQVAPLVREVYRKSGVGCCLHIVLDDGNVSDGDVRFCIDYAKQQGHDDCLSLAETLLAMSKTQRLKLGRMKFEREEPGRG